MEKWTETNYFIKVGDLYLESSHMGRSVKFVTSRSEAWCLNVDFEYDDITHILRVQERLKEVLGRLSDKGFTGSVVEVVETVAIIETKIGVEDIGKEKEV